MKSATKCLVCGEFEEEIIYAGSMPEGKVPNFPNIIKRCENLNCNNYYKNIKR